MTANQVAYYNATLSDRHNRIAEAETFRHNYATERETRRMNTANITLNQMSLAETQRSNRANEDINRERNAVTREGNRLNYATNREKNQIQREGNYLNYSSDIYSADKKYASSVYSADRSYAASKYNTDRNYDLQTAYRNAESIWRAQDRAIESRRLDINESQWQDTLYRDWDRMLISMASLDQTSLERLSNSTSMMGAASESAAMTDSGWGKAERIFDTGGSFIGSVLNNLLGIKRLGKK